MTVRGRSPHRDEYSKKRWPCDCGWDMHGIVLYKFDLGDPEYASLSLLSEVSARTFPDRIKAALRLLRRGQYCSGNVIFPDTDTMRELAATLTEWADAHDNTTKESA